MPGETFSVKEAAAYLGLTVRGLRYWIYEADEPIEFHRLNERTIFFDRDQLERFKERGERKPGRPKSKPNT